ncbi:MAG TPA: hypothetical protein VMH02_09250, partial [Verrucomicrobiae bacterium]|nr:hypothetical protein [Verrucomicrobiae bacterium]
VLGARAASDAVRRGASRAVVTLAFDPDDRLRDRMNADGFESDPGETVAIVREVADTGRSAIRLNGRPATAAYVRDVAQDVAELVGQHEAQRLLAPAYHLELLDRYAGKAAEQARDAVAAAHARATQLVRDLHALEGDEGRARVRYDDARFAASEIEEARLERGEAERLLERRRYLDNVERIAVALRRAGEAISGDEAGASNALGDARAALSAIAEIAADFAAMCGQAATLQSEAADLGAQVARALEAAEFDPAELDAVNARLETIDRLERKYGGTVDAVLDFAREARAAIENYEGRDRAVAALSEAATAAGRELAVAAASLTQLRKAAAAQLSRAVMAELGDLALGSGRFDVAVEPLEPIGPGGAERIEFLFAANAGEPARPLARVASGGELSRVLLALVVVLAASRAAHGALVFDEIDAGIGGATATAVGARIGRLAAGAQVVAVTHLAQLATWADRHYVLEKSESRGETTISVRELTTASAREAELARMLSGETHDAALRHARQLLAQRRA